MAEDTSAPGNSDAADVSPGNDRATKQARRLALRRQRMGLPPEPGDAALLGPTPERRGSSLDAKVKRLTDEAELLRTKLFQVHRALIAAGALKPTELGAPGGEAVPEERSIGGHDRVVLAFGGMASRLQMPPAEFGRTFAERNTDLIFFKDLQQCWYQQGLLGMTADVPSTAEYIKGLARQHGWKRVFTVGTSAGGYAAILFGALVGAERVVAFSPQTLVGRQVFRKFASTDSRADDMDLKARYLDLAKVLEETGFSGRIDLYYGAQNKMDILAADWLRRFECVTLHPVETAAHNSAQKVRDDGKFGEAFNFLD